MARPSASGKGRSSPIRTAVEHASAAAVSIRLHARASVPGRSDRLTQMAPLTASFAAFGPASASISGCSRPMPMATVIPLTTCAGHCRIQRVKDRE
jgi:hypothetical protein